MWPFSRKPTKPPEAPAPAAEPAAPPARVRTATDVLRQLDAEAATKPRTGRPDPLLGQTLLAEGPVTREFLKKQLAVGGKSDSYLGRILADTAAPAEADLFDLLARGYRVPEVDLKQCKVNVAAARSVPRDITLKYRIVPIDRVGDLLCVAFSERPNPNAIEAIRRATGLRVKALLCPPHHIMMLLRRLYTPGAAAPAAQAVAALPISEDEFNRLASAADRTEAHWESLHATSGPLRAVRLGRK